MCIKIRYLVATIISLELLPSAALWLLSPTDSVRIWYPSWFSYAGEHALTSSALFAILWQIARFAWPSTVESGHHPAARTLSVPAKGFSLLLVIPILTDITSTAIVWAAQTRDALPLKLWYTQQIHDLLLVRGLLYVTLEAAAIALGFLQHALRRVAQP